MKKLLPRTSKNPQGFTLVELMVVISIIAILSVVGFSVFSGTQKQTRDAVRRSEIDSISKSIEVYKDPATQLYSYTVANYTSDFPQNKAYDRQGTTFYCTDAGGAAIVAPTFANWGAGTCPANWTQFSDANGLTAAAATKLTAVKYWMVCAKLEATSSVVCKASLN